MKNIAVLLVLLALPGGAGAQTTLPDPNLTTRSFSGQFFVRAPGTPADPRLVSQLTAGGNYIQLDPSLLIVSSERLKQLLWRKLADKPTWRGRIYLDLRHAGSADENVRLVSEKFSDGWRYRVQLPDVIEHERFVRAIVQVLLLEIANRSATERSSELPLWLVEGLSHELLASGDMAGELKIFLPPPKTVVRTWSYNREGLNNSERRTNALYWAHVVLGSQPPLTFEELSWPADNQLATDASEVYQSSAQLFVDRLLEFKDGPACLRAMLGELPRHLNWQLAFLNAFQARFQNALDVEKWWAVQVSHFTGRELEQTWSSGESWNKLDALIRAPVQVRTGGGDQPLRTEVTMQTLLRDANGLEQTRFFGRQLNSLNSLRLRASPDLVGLVDDYRQAIGAFLEKQKITNPFQRVRKFHELTVNRAAKNLILRLDALEIKRVALRPAPPKPDAPELENISAAFR